ncbi:MAG: hypothetical protein MJA83_12650 [Gammaproteobacteria bacterium]|nr:hypothetical protein [Gammaproteobacteria bacterium]
MFLGIFGAILGRAGQKDWVRLNDEVIDKYYDGVPDVDFKNIMTAKLTKHLKEAQWVNPISFELLGFEPSNKQKRRIFDVVSASHYFLIGASYYLSPDARTFVVEIGMAVSERRAKIDTPGYVYPRVQMREYFYVSDKLPRVHRIGLQPLERAEKYVKIWLQNNGELFHRELEAGIDTAVELFVKDLANTYTRKDVQRAPIVGRVLTVCSRSMHRLLEKEENRIIVVKSNRKAFASISTVDDEKKCK